MDVTVSTYSNYQSGFSYNRVTQSSPEDSAVQPVVNKASQKDVTRPSRVEQNTPDRNPSESENSASQPQSNTTLINGQELTPSEIQLLDELEKIDTEVRRHEMAHIAAGGRYITSGANFTYQRGPDGKNYAVGGEVGIDTSPVPGDPQATLRKMRQVKSAALAPANPSSQDIKVASNATQAASKALSDLMLLQAKDQADSNESKAFGNLKDATDTYEKISNLPEQDTSSFKIAV